MNATTPLRVAIVGCGYAAERLHLPALRSLRGVRATAIVDVDAGRLEQVGNRFAIKRRYRDVAALFGDADVDAVAVCVPPRDHGAVALAALEAEKHVLVEKPLCLDLAEAGRLTSRARLAPVVAMMGFNFRFHRHVVAARGAIAGGRIGQIVALRTVWTSRMRADAGLAAWRERRASGGGTLNELATHHVDLWRFLTGSEVAEIFAIAGSETSEDDTASISGRMRCGAICVATLSQRAAEAHEIEVVGSDGRIAVSPYRFDGFELTPASVLPGSVEMRLSRLRRTLRSLPGVAATIARGGTFLEAYRAEWRHFADCIAGRTAPVATLDDGERALEVVSAAFESSRTRRIVPVGGGGRSAGELAG